MLITKNSTTFGTIKLRTDAVSLLYKLLRNKARRPGS